LNISTWIGVLIVDYYTIFSEKLGLLGNNTNPHETKTMVITTETTDNKTPGKSKISQLLKSGSKTLLMSQEELYQKSLTRKYQLSLFPKLVSSNYLFLVREKIFTEQASIFTLLMEWYSLSTTKIPDPKKTGDSADGSKMTKWVHAKQLPTDAFTKDFFRTLHSSENRAERNDPEKQMFGDSMTKTEGWEAMIDVMNTDHSLHYFSTLIIFL
jgi:hypothetical protein